jgi:hypothetical protein
LCSRAGETSLQSLALRSAVDSFPNRSSREFTGPSRCGVSVARLATNDGRDPWTVRSQVVGLSCAPPLRLPVAQPASEALSPPTLPALRRRERTSRPSLSFGALADRPGRTADASACATFLSWDPSAQNRSRAGRRAIHPSIDITVSVHSHATCPSRFGQRGATLASPVPPSWFRTTSAVSSAPGFAGLLHPAADPGVRCVSRTAPGDHRSGSGDARTLLATWIRYPSKDIPRRQPHRVTAAVAPLPLARLA